MPTLNFTQYTANLNWSTVRWSALRYGASGYLGYQITAKIVDRVAHQYPFAKKFEMPLCILGSVTAMAIGAGYLAHRSVYLLGGAALLAGALAILTFYSSSSISPQNREIKNKTISHDEMLQNEELILKFATDSRANDLILKGREKKRNLHLLTEPAFRRFGETYPSCPEVQTYVHAHIHAMYHQEVLNELIVMPFVSLGIMNTSWIKDPEVVRTVQSFQVRIFKYWLSLYQMGTRDECLLTDLLTFCKSSPLEVFSKHIGSFLQFFADDERDYDEVIYFFLGGEWIKNEQSTDEEDTNTEPLPTYLEELKQRVCQQISDELAQHFADAEAKKSPGAKLVENFELALKQEQPELIAFHAAVDKEHFSKDAVVRLFLEIAEG